MAIGVVAAAVVLVVSFWVTFRCHGNQARGRKEIAVTAPPIVKLIGDTTER